MSGQPALSQQDTKILLLENVNDSAVELLATAG
jgi:hypothetical protein